MFTKAEQEPMREMNPKPRYDNEGVWGPTPLPAPQVVVAGPLLDIVVRGRKVDQVYAVGDETILLEKTSHVRGKKETMNQFYARVGLGKAQILAMSKDEITKFVNVVSQNEQVAPPRYTSLEKVYEALAERARKMWPNRTLAPIE